MLRVLVEVLDVNEGEMVMVVNFSTTTTIETLNVKRELVVSLLVAVHGLPCTLRVDPLEKVGVVPLTHLFPMPPGKAN